MARRLELRNQAAEELMTGRLEHSRALIDVDQDIFNPAPTTTPSNGLHVETPYDRAVKALGGRVMTR
jgi:hypothetical protein